MKLLRTSVLVFSAATFILLLFFCTQSQVPTVSARPSYTSSNVNAPTTDTCKSCHSGSAAAGGSAVVVFPSGMTYTPGVTQHLSVKITDPTHIRGGYLLTARLASTISSQAGSFTATDANSTVVKNGATIQDLDAVNFATLMWNFDWTPPAAGAGNVNFYLIGYATGSPGGSTSGNGAYQSVATLTPAGASPDFSLSASPGSVTVIQGSTGSSTVTVAPLNGFTGSVSLAASGLPSGVTASFTPASATSTSSLTLTASATATTGTSTVTITGTSGSLTHTTTVSLTVSAPANFTLSASPSSLTVAQGFGGSSSITVAPVSGFTGSVSLAASGLPSGVTASFNPASATTTSSLTLTASATAAIGTSTVTITGTSGSLTHTATVSLTVSATATADFGLSASPTSLAVTQGSNGSSTITVAPQNGFTGSVSLAASGLPSGVTASFNPASTKTTSSLTLTASATATPGTSTVTITGTSGSLSHTTTISLTVSAPVNFTLSASPTSLTVMQGSAGSSTITVAPVNGFTGSVSLAASGLPSGVTASFNPASATTTSSLTLTASATAASGTSTVTITGTSGSLTHTTTVSLTVPTTLTATPTALSFNDQIGSPAPATQAISVTGSAAMSFTATASGGTWLSAAPASGTTPATVNVTVNPAGLAAGSYSGTVSIASPGALGSPQAIPITLTVSNNYTRQPSTTPSSSSPNFLINAKDNYDVMWTDVSAGVFFSRSTDQGNTFPTNVVIPGTTGAALQPQFVEDSTGNNVDVVWAQSTSTAGTYNVLFSRSTDGGQHFAAPTSLTSASLPLADAPRMALEPGGGVDVVWGRNEAWAIHSSNGSTFPTAPVKISTAAQDSGGPRIAVDSKGTIYVAWTDEVNKLATGSYCTQTGTSGTTTFTNTLGGNFYFNVTATGSSFSPANTRDLSNTDWAGVVAKWQPGFFGCSYDNLILLVDSQNNLHLIWSDDMPDENVLVSAYPLISAGKSRVSFPTSISSSPAASPYAVIANNSNGVPTVHVAWSDGPGDLTAQATPGIYYAHSTDTIAPFGQTFAASPTRVASATSEFPQVGVDGSGAVDVAWQQTDPLNPSAFDVVVSPSFDGGSTFSVKIPVSISSSTDCLGPNTTDTTQIPPPPDNICGTVQLKVDSGNASNLVWVDSGSNILFARQTLPPPGDFAVTLNTASQTVAAAGTATYTLTVTAANGFTQAVTLTCPNGLPPGAACADTTVVPAPSGSSAVVSVLTVSSVRQGTFPFTITATAGTLTHSVQATLVIAPPPPPDFSVSVPSPSVTSSLGQTASYAVNIGSSGGFNSPVSITCVGLPIGAPCSSSPASLTPPGSAIVTVTISALQSGTYPFTIIGSDGVANHSVQATLVVSAPVTPDFSVSLPSSSITTSQGQTVNYGVNIGYIAGPSELVSLGCSGLPAGAACASSPASVTPPGSANLTVSVTSTVQLGTYPFTITGSNGVTNHSVQATLVVSATSNADFSLSVPSPSMMSLQGQTVSYAVSIGYTTGPNSPVTLACAGLPPGATCTSNPASVAPPAATTVALAVPGALPPGTYPFTITGSNGVANHSQPATLVVGKLTATVGPSTSATIAVGSSANFTVSLASSNGYSGPVNLSCGGIAPGLTCLFSSAQLNVLSSGPVTTTMTVMVGAKPAFTPFHRSPDIWPDAWRWTIAFSALFLLCVTTLIVFRRDGTLSGTLIRGLAALALIVLLGTGLTSCAGVAGGTGGKPAGGGTGGNPVVTQFTLQAQSGSATINLSTISITVP